MTTDTGTIRTHTASPSTTQQGITAALLLVLGLLSAVAPFATDLYLPAFPRMTTDLGASATAVQLTLTAFLVGVTAGQLVFAGGLEEDLDLAFSADATSGEVLVTDGPFVETKEWLGGLTIVDVPDVETARMWAARIAVACGWPQEVRPFGPGSAP